jgi:hypothetical protein
LLGSFLSAPSKAGTVVVVILKGNSWSLILSFEAINIRERHVGLPNFRV